MIEKPTPTEAEQRLIVPGLRAGHYLCFFRHARADADGHGDPGRPARARLPAPQPGDKRAAASRSPPRWPNWPARAVPGAGTARRALRSSGVKYGLLDGATGAGAAAAATATRCLPQLLELLAQRELGRQGQSRHQMSELTRIITAAAPAVRNRSLDAFCRTATLPELWPGVHRRWTASAATATTSTSACARCSFSTPSTASTCPLQAGAAHRRR